MDSKKQFLWITISIIIISVLSIIYLVIIQPTRVEISKDLIISLEKINTTLNKITNKETALEFRTELEDNIAGFNKVLKKAEDMNPPKSQAEKDEINKVLKDLNLKAEKLQNLIDEKLIYYEEDAILILNLFKIS
tara:strand:+ start:588 stop:992 length:405 start_codon:yes stop_codon:yes gene_type:complete